VIGQTIERFKNPKNAVSTLVGGWILCIAAFFMFVHWEIPVIAKLIALAGMAMILVTLVRLSLTKILLLIVCAAAVFAYLAAYGVAGGRVGNNALFSCAFAPAAMTEAVLTGASGQDYLKEEVGGRMDVSSPYNELREGAKAKRP
jgi:hypothetical protein